MIDLSSDYDLSLMTTSIITTMVLTVPVLLLLLGRLLLPLLLFLSAFLSFLQVRPIHYPLWLP